MFIIVSEKTDEFVTRGNHLSSEYPDAATFETMKDAVEFLKKVRIDSLAIVREYGYETEQVVGRREYAPHRN